MKNELLLTTVMKVNLFLCFTKHHAMRIYGEAEIQLCESQRRHKMDKIDHFHAPVTLQTGVKKPISPRASLEVIKKRTISALVKKGTMIPQIRSP
jgi:hypothetical protein